MNFLLQLLKTPSSFEGEPWKYARNQIGHGYILGGGLTLLFSLPAALAIYFAIEAIQLMFFGSELWDSVEDYAFFLTIALAASFSFWPLLVVHSMFLIAGVCRRLK